MQKTYLILLLVTSLSLSQVVKFLAGAGNQAPYPDPIDGDAQSCQFGEPYSILPFSSGILVCGHDTNRLRFVDFNKNETDALFVTTFAGQRSSGIVSSTLLDSKFLYPADIAIQSNGDIYLIDVISLRKIQGNTVENIIFPTTSEPFGITLDDAEEFLYMTFSTSIIKVNLGDQTSVLFAGHVDEIGSTDGSLTDARFNDLRGIVYVAGALYVTDSANNNIRKVDISSGLVSTFSGPDNNGTASYKEGVGTDTMWSYPKSLYVVDDDNLIVCDNNNHVLRKLQISTRQSSLLVGTVGVASTTDGDQEMGPLPTLDGPLAVGGYDEIVVDHRRLFVAGEDNKVREIDFRPRHAGVINVTDVREYSTTVYVERPQFNGGFDITGYSIYFTSEDHSYVAHFRNLTSNSPAVGLVLTEGLLQNTTYSVYASSWNAFGESQTNSSFQEFSFTTMIGCGGILQGEPGVCFDNGECVGPETCACALGWIGELCQDIDCFGIGSSNESSCTSSERGTCTAYNNCTCNFDYWGHKCQNSVCYGKLDTDDDVCSGIGECVAHDECVCPENEYSGDECEFRLCFGKKVHLFNSSLSDPAEIVCSGHGDCISPNTCDCHARYTNNSDCSVPDMCSGIPYYENSTCSNHGDCLAMDSCDCEDRWGYRDPITCSLKDQCHGIDYNLEEVCSVRGDCVNTAGVPYCDCPARWGSVDDCSEADMCEGVPFYNLTLVCSGRGTCELDNTCTCPSRWESQADCSQPDMCEGVAFFEDSVCSTRGDCEIDNTCTCPLRWQSAADCSLPDECEGVPFNDQNVCSGRGNCSISNVCECPERWQGEANCSTPDTCHEIAYFNTSFVCSNRGDCENDGDGSYCLCQYRWGSQDDCSVADTCHGVVYDAPGVCSGHGVCTFSTIDSSVCVCEARWGSQEDCSVEDTCFGILHSNTSFVCNGHGNCTAFDVCECPDGYTTDDCVPPGMREEPIAFDPLSVAIPILIVVMIFIICLVVVLSLVSVYILKKVKMKSGSIKPLEDDTELDQISIKGNEEWLKHNSDWTVDLDSSFKPPTIDNGRAFLEDEETSESDDAYRVESSSEGEEEE